MTAHLGPVVTAFVDGELDHDSSREVAVHLAHCGPCRIEVDVLRGLKVALRSTEPSLPSGLAERLMSLPQGEPPPLPAAPRGRSAHLRRQARLRRAALGGAVVVLGLGGALGVAGPPPPGPVAPVDPTSAQFVVDRQSTTSEMPFADVSVNTASLRSVR